MAIWHAAPDPPFVENCEPDSRPIVLPRRGALLALLVFAFVKNALGLVGMTPEQQDIVTGLVLVGTLIIFGASRNLSGLRAFVAVRRLKR